MQGVTDKSAREKILRATISMIDRGGKANLTVREISKSAGVNIGAVNYYFGSKKELMMRAAGEILESTHKSFSALDDKTLPALERLEGFLTGFIKKLVARHNFFSQELFWRERHFEDQEDKHEMMKRFKSIGIDKIKATIMELDGELDESHATLLALQLFSAAVMPNTLFMHRGGSGAELEPQVISIEEQVHGLLVRMFGEGKCVDNGKHGAKGAPETEGGASC